MHSWKQADADAHIAKSDALEHAILALAALDGMIDVLAAAQVQALVRVLVHHRERHEQAAKLAAA